MMVAVALRRDALRSYIFSLAACAVTSLGAFALSAALSALTTLRGAVDAVLGSRQLVVVCLFGLIGTPPTRCSSGN